MVIGGCISGQLIVWDLSCQESRIGTHGGAAANAASGKKPDGSVRMPDEEEDKTQ